jgi:hypothetical protein
MTCHVSPSRAFSPQCDITKQHIGEGMIRLVEVGDGE